MSDRYEIREQIGKGGLGAVYKAFDTQLQREVAIKRVLSPDQATEEEVEEAAKKLIAEAQTLSTLNHPNIITVFDVGQDDQGGFVVMELLKGETLDDTIERGVLTQNDFTEVVYQSMEALIAAQASNVIHRDIKPTNIMVIWQASGKFQIKILDFGLAKFSKSPSVQTMDQEESVLGSIFFMAPEQFERGELDARTDIYQMGCVFYNALTGQYPFNGETAPQVMNAHLQHKVIPLEQVRPDLPPAICQWVMWLINRDIDHRPADARDALKRWPRNPDPAGEIPTAKALLVEDTPSVSTGEIKIVTASKAAAPPSLIVPSSDSAPIVGSRTGRLSGSQPVRPRGATGPLTGTPGRNRPNVRKSSEEGGNPKVKLYLFAGIGAVILAFVALKVISSAGAKKAEQRIVTLAEADAAGATSDDIETALSLLAEKELSVPVKKDAISVLKQVDTTGADEIILSSLQSSDNPPLQLLLSGILSERAYTAAVPAIIEGFNNAATDDQRLEFLGSIRPLAGFAHIELLLESMLRSHSLKVRRAFEDTVLAVLRKSEIPASFVDDLLTRISSTSGDPRKSLFRLLGALGDDKTLTRLTSIYSTDNDPAYQRDAMIAFLNWPNRQAVPQLAKIINETSDEALRSAAERAFARLAMLPAPEPITASVELWDRAFNTVGSSSDIQRLVRTVIANPSRESLQLLQKWAKHDTFGSYAKGSLPTLNLAIKTVPTITPGEALKGNKSRVQGDNGAAINSSLGSLTKWVSPESWFTWSFKIDQPGNYSIEVLQASLEQESSEFEIYLNGQTFRGRSQKTKTLEDFTTVKTDGKVQLQADKIYTLILKAGRKVQPRMMDIGAIKLTK
ncbi:MAG: serine/threonine-protein kinase [Verrucomicrobiales bacterium]|nr:serine/threonine-protein kinase [Verrucomicrobiales bacterium]